MFKLLITGSRNDPDEMMKARIHYCLGRVAHALCPEGGELSNGDAPGVDTEAAVYWRSLGSKFTTREFPYPSGMGRRGGPLRNQQMVDYGAHLCLAFPEVSSVGTYDCAKKANKAGIPTFIFSGRLHRYGMTSFDKYLVDKSLPVWYPELNV